MQDGSIRTRSGDAYKPSVVRSYDSVLRVHIYPELGGLKLSEVTRRHVQAFANGLLAKNLNASTIRNALMPLRVIYGRSLADDEVSVDPVKGVRLPAVRGTRDRIASPDEAMSLLTALPDSDRALWACAFYGGLRRGELRGLRWEDVNLANGVICVERSWDDKADAVEPKSKAGKRKVPIAAVLRDYLDEHKLRCPWSDGLVFGTSATQPFTPSAVRRRAHKAWNATNEQACEADPEAEQLEPIGLHEARHCFASMMIAAGVNAKALSSYMGHSSVTITYDRYGHLMPGNEEEAAALLDAYLERANTQARLASLT